MAKTNIGLVAHCEKALKEKWFYLWGTFGAIATQKTLDDKIKQYSDNAIWRSYCQGAIGKTRFCDCYGLVKSYLWWVDDNSDPKYNSKQDTNTSGAYNNAKEKGGISTLPEIPGIVLYMPGHVGVYMGKGRFVELMGNGVGAYEGSIKDGKITKGSKFTHWFKDVNIEYVKETVNVEVSKNIEIPKVDEYIISSLELVKDGKTIITNNIFFNGRNYVELRNYEESYGNIVKYDNDTRKIEIISKTI